MQELKNGLKKFINIYKPVGLSPLQAIHVFTKNYPEYKNETLSYAGRLDPMAEGLLLILVGEENKKRKEYERLSKEYEFEILWGISTDTYDIMGIITAYEKQITTLDTINKYLHNTISLFTGTFEQEYPPFSSAKVLGKPLYYYAREGTLTSIEIPKKTITVKALRHMNSYFLSPQEVHSTIIEKVSKARGEFRQNTIIEQWNDYFTHKSLPHYSISRLSITCNSGTYVRGLVHEISKKTGIHALAFSIKRIAVGKLNIDTSIHLFP